MLTVIAVGAGVSLAVSILVVAASVPASFAAAGRRLAGPAPLRIVGATSHGGIDEAVITQASRVDGVAAVAPIVQTVTLADPQAGAPSAKQVTVVALGADCRAAAVLAAVACTDTPASLPPLVAPHLLAELGRGGAVRSDEGLVSLANAVAVPQLDGINGGRAVAFLLPDAQRLFGRPHAVDLIYVTPRPGVSIAALRQRLIAAIGSWNGVLTSTDPPPGTQLAAGSFLPIFGLLGLFALGVAAVLVYNTLSLSMEERRRDLAVIGALGAPSRVIMAGTLAEAVTLGVVGGGLGTAGGVLLARPLLSTFSTLSERLAGIPIAEHITAFPLVAGVALGAVVGLAAAWLPARRALRIDVAAELSNRELRAEAAPALAVARGVLFLAVAVVGLDLCWIAQQHGALRPWQTSLVAPGILATTIGLIIAGGAFGPVVARLGERATRNRNGPLRLALANCIREPGRTGVMVIAIGAALGTAFVTASFNVSINAGIVKGTTAFSSGRVAVSTVPPDNSINVDGRPSEAVLSALRRVAGVAAVDRLAVLLTGHTEKELIGVEAADHPNLSAMPLLQGSRDLAAFDRGEAMIGPALARSANLRAGSLLRLETPAGYASVPVLGVWQYGDFNGRSATIPMGLLERLYGPQRPITLEVRPAPGLAPGELARRIAGAHLDPDLVARTPVELAAVASRDIRQQLAPFWAIQRGLLLVAFIAVISTLLLVGAQRRRELGLLAAVGMRPSELARMVLTEAGVIGVIGVAVGAVMSFGMYVAMFFVIPILIGYKDPFRLDFGSVAFYGPISVVVVLAAAVWPAWRTAHLEVLPALQYE